MSPPPQLWKNKPAASPSESTTASTSGSDDLPPPKPLWGGGGLEEKSSGADLREPVSANTEKDTAVDARRRKIIATALKRRKAQSVYTQKACGAEMTRLATDDGHEYELGETLGTGAFATVRVATAVGSNETFAVKVFTKSFLKKRRFSQGLWRTNLDGVHREIAIMKLLTHRNVMRLHDMSETNNHLYMVMDYCPRGAVMLTEKLPCLPLPMEDAKRWFADAVIGLEYLHFEGIVHHDLKPDNILISSKGSAVLSDFGVSRAQAKSKNGTACSSGTPLYNAPEKFYASAKAKYDGRAADVWALGVTLHAMMLGRLPYPSSLTPEQLEEAICDEAEWSFQRPWRWCVEADAAAEAAAAHPEPELIALLSGMLRKSPEERFKLEDVRDHDWCEEHCQAEDMLSGTPRSGWRKVSVTSAAIKNAVHQSVLMPGTSSMTLGRRTDKSDEAAPAFTVQVPQVEVEVIEEEEEGRRSSFVAAVGGCFGRLSSLAASLTRSSKSEASRERAERWKR